LPSSPLRATGILSSTSSLPAEPIPIACSRTCTATAANASPARLTPTAPRPGIHDATWRCIAASSAASRRIAAERTSVTPGTAWRPVRGAVRPLLPSVTTVRARSVMMGAVVQGPRRGRSASTISVAIAATTRRAVGRRRAAIPFHTSAWSAKRTRTVQRGGRCATLPWGCASRYLGEADPWSAAARPHGEPPSAGRQGAPLRPETGTLTSAAAPSTPRWCHAGASGHSDARSQRIAVAAVRHRDDWAASTSPRRARRRSPTARSVAAPRSCGSTRTTRTVGSCPH
jgi:hypothetical protein